MPCNRYLHIEHPLQVWRLRHLCLRRAARVRPRQLRIKVMTDIFCVSGRLNSVRSFNIFFTKMFKERGKSVEQAGRQQTDAEKLSAQSFVFQFSVDFNWKSFTAAFLTNFCEN